MLVNVAVACRDASGAPTFFPCRVNCSEEEFELGTHYDVAEVLADDEGYESPMLCFDGKEAPEWLLERFDWESVEIVKV